MPWGKMDDKFHRNKKVRDLRRLRGGREALGVWTFWWSWCLDDPDLTGFVPQDELPPADAKAAELLVQVELWDRVDGGYQFHDFAEYNPTRKQVADKREADRLRVAATRQATRENVARDTAATSERVASTRVPVPSPSHPVPSQPKGESLSTPPPEASPPDPDEGPLDGYSRIEPDTRWLDALEVFERVVHDGKRSVPHNVAHKHFSMLWPMLVARDAQDPLGVLERVLRLYLAAKRAKGTLPKVEYLCADFAQYADKPGAAAAVPDRQEQLRRLRLELSEARIAADLAADNGDAATQERHAGRAKQLADKIEQLATRAA